MPQSSRRRLANKDGERHSRDQKHQAMRERGDECDTSKPKGIRLLLGLWHGQIANGRRSGILGGCGHSGRWRSKWEGPKSGGNPDYKRGQCRPINLVCIAIRAHPTRLTSAVTNSPQYPNIHTNCRYLRSANVSSQYRLERRIDNITHI
jgi:hypothetical protein